MSNGYSQKTLKNSLKNQSSLSYSNSQGKFDSNQKGSKQTKTPNLINADG